MAKISYPSIPHDAIIDIQISGYFYEQLVNSMTALSESRPQEELNSALLSMKEDRPAKDYYEASVRTFVSLVYEIESKAKFQNKMTDVEIEVEDSTEN